MLQPHGPQTSGSWPKVCALLLAVLAVAGLAGCSSRYQRARLASSDPDFNAKLDALAAAYQSRSVDKVMRFYAQDTYSLSFDMPYKFDTGAPRHRSTLERLLGEASELTVELAPKAESIWKTRERVWTTRYLKAAGTIGEADSFRFEGWHSAIWEKRGDSWLIAYEHFAGPFERTSPPPPTPIEEPPAETTTASLTEPPPPPPAPAPEAELPPDVFFDYDKWNIRADQVAPMDAVVAWLQAYPSARLTIEGHCDERGDVPYNIALGWRRAESAKAYLIANGIDAARLTTISFGKTRPFAQGHGETSWWQNRRAHFVPQDQ